jgi:glutathione peroxidase
MISRRRVIQTSVVVAAAVLAVVGAIAWRLSTVASVATPASLSFYDLTAPARDGRVTPLAAYRGQVALVVNVASECGLAFQYPGLDALYKRYRDRSFVILAFPSNDFWQEPNDDAGIQRVCDARGVTFPVFGKGHIRGGEQSAVYAFLSSTGKHRRGTSRSTWSGATDACARCSAVSCRQTTPSSSMQSSKRSAR